MQRPNNGREAAAAGAAAHFLPHFLWFPAEPGLASVDEAPKNNPKTKKSPGIVEGDRPFLSSPLNSRSPLTQTFTGKRPKLF